jgi:hypothetical protein
MMKSFEASWQKHEGGQWKVEDDGNEADGEEEDQV